MAKIKWKHCKWSEWQIHLSKNDYYYYYSHDMLDEHMLNAIDKHHCHRLLAANVTATTTTSANTVAMWFL